MTQNETRKIIGYVIRSNTDESSYVAMDTVSGPVLTGYPYFTSATYALVYNSMSEAVNDMHKVRSFGHDVSVCEREVVETCVAR